MPLSILGLPSVRFKPLEGYRFSKARQNQRGGGRHPPPPADENPTEPLGGGDAPTTGRRRSSNDSRALLKMGTVIFRCRCEIPLVQGVLPGCGPAKVHEVGIGKRFRFDNRRVPVVKEGVYFLPGLSPARVGCEMVHKNKGH